MDSSDKLFYYAIPLSIFGLVALIAVFIFKKEMGWAVSRYAFIIAFVISFPVAVCCYDWSAAYETYSDEMEEEFGEDWEDELEDARIESLSRRP